MLIPQFQSEVSAHKFSKTLHLELPHERKSDGSQMLSNEYTALSKEK